LEKLKYTEIRKYTYINTMAKKQIEQYEHTGKERANNPHVGLVTPVTDPDTGEKKTYAYDPHLEPQLQWAGKAEHTSFKVPTVSLHVHERIDPNTIIEAVKKEHEDYGQQSLFAEKKPLREAIDFYKHKENWSNRLVAGDSLLVMNSLLEKEGMAGKVQMMYFDPPYGIKYGSNFQPFVNKRDVKDGKDDDLSAEPEMIKAFRDTWELGIHSYLTYLRDRLLVARELLSDSGSVFIQISDENVHLVRCIMDEVFGKDNFLSQIAYRTSGSLSADVVSGIYDILIWYGKDTNKTKINPLFIERDFESYRFVELPNGNRIATSQIADIPKNAKYYTTENLVSSGYTQSCIFPIEFEGRVFKPNSGKSWKTTKDGIEKLIKAKRLQASGQTIRYVLFYDDYPVLRLTNLWTDLAGSPDKIYAVQTSPKVIQRCMLMTTNPGDLVLDITCGSGTSAIVAEQWGRRWITCDTSRVALTLAKQRLMTANFDYYQLAHLNEGVDSGFKYKTVPHITLGSIANNEIAPEETLYDQPIIEKSKARITGPFTVEAVPAPSGGPYLSNGQSVEKSQSFDDLENDSSTGSDTSIARTGETLRQSEWRDELLKSGVRAKAGNIIPFTRVEPLSGTKYIQAEAETKEDNPKKVLVVFGPEHAPLEQRMVENAWQEARALRPDILLFCAFQFDEEAAKDIDELTPAIAGMQLLKAQMNADMLTDDLRKKRSSNESFWLVGQPDVQIHKLDNGKVQVEVMGFDYYNPKTGNVESGGKKNIAMWMLDTDYDNRSLFPSQVFFPMAGEGDGWDKLAKNLKAEIDEEKIEAFKGTISLEFQPGSSIAVKIIDDRGIECLRVIKM
jgi:adenine-specific DNA-methyltransferase